MKKEGLEKMNRVLNGYSKRLVKTINKGEQL